MRRPADSIFAALANRSVHRFRLRSFGRSRVVSSSCQGSDSGFRKSHRTVEKARTTRSYAWQVSAQDVWVARSGQFIWIRMEPRQEYKDILFPSLSEVH